MNFKDGSHPVLSYFNPLVNVNYSSTFHSESICSDSRNLSVTKLLINGKDRGRTNSCFLPSPSLMYEGAQWKSIYNKYGLSVSTGQGKGQSAQTQLHNFHS